MQLINVTVQATWPPVARGTTWRCWNGPEISRVLIFSRLKSVQRGICLLQMKLRHLWSIPTSVSDTPSWFSPEYQTSPPRQGRTRMCLRDCKTWILFLSWRAAPVLECLGGGGGGTLTRALRHNHDTIKIISRRPLVARKAIFTPCNRVWLSD